MINKESFHSIISYDRKSNPLLSKNYYIIPTLIFAIVFVFNLPYLFVDILYHDDGVWYYRASEGEEIYKFAWRAKIAILTPFRDWFYSYSMVNLGLPFTRGVFVAIMAFISLLLFNLYNKVFGVDAKVAFLAAVIPGILPSLKGIPVGLNASYAMWGLLPIIGSLLVLHKALVNKGKQSLSLLLIALLLYATALNLIESTNFLIPSVLLFFLYYFPNNKIKAILYATPFLLVGLWQVYKQFLFTHKEPTTIPLDVILNRSAQFAELSSFISFNQPYSIYITIGLSLLGIIGLVLFVPSVVKMPVHFNFKENIYRFLIVLWPIAWVFFNSYAYIFKSPTFRPHDYAYVFNYGMVFLQASGLVFLLTLLLLVTSNKKAKKTTALLAVGVIVIWTGIQRVNNASFSEADSYSLIREALSQHDIAPAAQIIIFNTRIMHEGHPLVNTGHIRYILKRNDIKAVIGPDRYPNNIFASYKTWFDRMVGFDPEKPVRAFIQSGGKLKQVELMLQVLSTGMEGSSRLSWNLFDIENHERPFIIASGIGLSSYFDFMKYALPLAYQNAYIAFAPDDHADMFLDKITGDYYAEIDGLVYNEVNFGGAVSLKNAFVKEIDGKTHLQMVIYVNRNPDANFKLSYIIDGDSHPVTIWSYAKEGDYVLITTPPMHPDILKQGFRLSFADSGVWPGEKLKIMDVELLDHTELFIRVSDFNQQVSHFTEKPGLIGDEISPGKWFSITNWEFHGNLEYFTDKLEWSVHSIDATNMNDPIAMGAGLYSMQEFITAIADKLQFNKNQIALASQDNDETKYIVHYYITLKQNGAESAFGTWHDNKIMSANRWMHIDYLEFRKSYIEPVKYIGLPEWTVSIWIKPQLPIPASTPFYRHYTIMEGENTSSFLGIDNTGAITIYKNPITPSNMIQPGWNFISYSYKDGVLSAYANGFFAGNYLVNNPLESVSRRRIGQQGSFTHYYVGHMMNAQLWNRALTQSEIQESMFARLNGVEPGLVGYWPMDSVFIDNGVKKTPDLSLSQNHGILVGEPVLIKGSDMLFENIE